MQQSKFQLVVFDWDGTLIDSARKICNCIQAAARDLQLVEPDYNQAKNIIGLDLLESMQILFPEQSRATQAELVERFRQHSIYDDVTAQPLFEGVEAGLARLDSRGVLLAVATGKARRGLTRVFADIDIEHYFVTTRCADESRSKPHPQMLEDILETTSIDPHKSIMVGDTSYDMQMAKNAGIPGLGAGYGVHSHSTLRKASAIDVLDSFSGVIDWLLKRTEAAFS